MGIGAAVNSSAFIVFVVRETEYYAALLGKPIIPEVKGNTALGRCVHGRKSSWKEMAKENLSGEMERTSWNCRVVARSTWLKEWRHSAMKSALVSKSVVWFCHLLCSPGSMAIPEVILMTRNLTPEFGSRTCWVFLWNSCKTIERMGQCKGLPDHINYGQERAGVVWVCPWYLTALDFHPGRTYPGKMVWW